MKMYGEVEAYEALGSDVVAQPPTTSDPKASYTHRQRLKLPQQHLPLDVRTTGRKSSSAKTAWPTNNTNYVIDSNRSPTPVNIP